VLLSTDRKTWAMAFIWESYGHRCCELRSPVSSKTAKRDCPSRCSPDLTPEASNQLAQHHCWEEHVLMFLTGLAYSPACPKKSPKVPLKEKE